MNVPSCSVVLIPGFMLDETLWDEFSQHLPENWRLVHAPLTGGTTIPEIARQIATISPDRFVLIGFSLGGYIARQLAADFPDQVMALVLIASSLREDTDQQAKVKAQAVQASSETSFRGLSNTAIATSLHPSRSSDKAVISRIKTMGQRLGYEALALQSSFSRAGVPTDLIRCPTLVVASSGDAMRTLEEADELVEAIPGALLQLINDSGHMIPLEQPRKLAQLILAWVMQVLQTTEKHDH
ncbi:alpha/beta hydrolase [Allohahella marinimesophila]|uniref:Alpha/beta hydrolase n=1 Tax=Allohahella marinimesophila TaxID=1054972 RepID=A0ABP7NIS8_9GAMM